VWRDGSTHRFPLDVWGQIEDVKPDVAGKTRLTLRDEAGRRVVISGVSSSRVEAVGAGHQVYMFGLRTRDRTGGQESWRHPRNFFESTTDDPYDRAWGLAVFRERNSR
jgi:hypothetical protein